MEEKKEIGIKERPEALGNNPSELGIKETKEALIGINELGLFFVERFKDGTQIGDFVAFWEKLKNDEDFLLIVQEAYRGINLISKEADNMNLAEGLELVTLQLGYIPKFVAALKAAPPAA